ncbi:dedicator of cytokinesis protein 4-like isoform X2 [Watersipora subatra]|uniref:dedicator of cytokinesis protein 4-like isoform X2 n=1 Tax=Watersipora subatra TaxID=2589382 RepID=UPI00355AF3EE
MVWTTTSQAQRKIGIAVCRFRKGDIAQAIDLNPCDTVVIEEQCPGWYKGYLLDDRAVSGIFPSEYVHVRKIDRSITATEDQVNNHLYSRIRPCEGLSFEDELIVCELTETLREWFKAIKELYINSPQDTMLAYIQKEIVKLLELRTSFTAPYLTSTLRTQLRTEITNKIDWGNKKLGLDVVPRVNGMRVGPKSISPIELHKIHLDTNSFTTGNMTLTAVRDTYNSHHLYLHFKTLSPPLNPPSGDGDLAIYFSIYNYNAGSPEFVSERVMCKQYRNGTQGSQAGQSFTAMFVDLTTADLNLEDAYLIAQVYKVGSLKNARADNGVIAYKRPYGCAVLPLRDVLHSKHPKPYDEEGFTKDFSMSLLPIRNNKDDDFSNITDHLIRKVKERKIDDKEIGAVNVALGMLHGEISSIRHKNPQLFTRSTIITQKLGFADVIAPERCAHYVLLEHETRNDFYVNLFEAEFERGAKRADRNIEAKILVVDDTGKELPCIAGDASDAPTSHYESAVFYHSNHPRWNEVVKIGLTEHQFHSCHLRIEFRHCSNNAPEKKLFAFSYIPLEDRYGTTVQDRMHRLCVYKPTKYESNSGMKGAAPHYLSLAFDSDSPGTKSMSNSQCTISQKESLFVRTTLCSTKLTQDANLVSFFKWKDDIANLDRVLLNVQRVKGDELMRHHTDFLNTLFQMTCDIEACYHQPRIFEALIHILKFSKEKNYQQFLPIIELYIERSFCAPLVHRELLTQIQRVLDGQDNQRELFKNVIAVFDLLFKFIIRSAYLHADKREDAEHGLLCMSMENFWKALQKLVKSTDKDGSKLTIITRVVDVFPELLKLLPPDSLASSFSETIRVIPKRNSDFGVHKLKCLSKLINSPLFDHEDSRHIVLDLCNSQILFCLQNQTDLKLVAENLSDLLAAIYKNRDTMKTEMELVVTWLIKPLATTILEGSESVRLLIGCLITMLSMMDEALFTKVLEHEKDTLVIKKLCSDLITIMSNIILEAQIPSDWIVLLILFNSVLLSTTKLLSQTMIDYFLSGSNFNELVWKNYFMLCVTFINQPCLQLETFSESKRMTLFSWYGDMRVKMGHILFDMWQELDSFGDYLTVFIPSMVGPFLQVALVPQSELRMTIIPVFYGMLMLDFEKVQGEIVDKLDELYIDGSGDLSFKTAFLQRIMESASSDSSGRKEQLTESVNSISLLIDLLYDYRCELNATSSEQGDTLRLSTLNLLDFYQNKIQRSQLYTKYVYKLRDLNSKHGFHTEAAFTLLLKASTLEWTDQHLVRDMSCPAQKEWERKEQYYLDIISYFDKGRCWEHAIPLCKELSAFYENQVYDFVKLQNLLSRQAGLLRKIVPGDAAASRLPSNYYRIAFYGQAFPRFLQNKSFIIKMNAFAGRDAVVSELNRSYPNAKVLPDPIKTPNPDQLTSNQQYYQVVKVEPDAGPSKLFSGALRPVDHRITSFYLWNNVTRFTYDQAFHSPTHDKENEHRTLHKLRYVMTTERPLPNILHWCEIINTEQRTLMPLEVALENMSKKNSSLREMLVGYQSDKQMDQKELSMSLKGTIDAQVNGGIPMYQNAFYSPEYAAAHPEHADLLNDFKQCVRQHVSILNDGLTLFKEIGQNELRPLINALCDEFKKLLSKVKETDSGCEVASLRSVGSGSFLSVSDSSRVSSGYSSSDVESVTPNRKSASISHQSGSFDEEGGAHSSSTLRKTRQDDHLTRSSRSTFYAKLPIVTNQPASPVKESRASSDEEDDILVSPVLPVKKRSLSTSSVQYAAPPASPSFDLVNRPLPATPTAQGQNAITRSSTYHGKTSLKPSTTAVYNVPRSPNQQRTTRQVHRPALPTPPDETDVSTARIKKRQPPPPPQSQISSTINEDERPELPARTVASTPTSEDNPPILPRKTFKPKK